MSSEPDEYETVETERVDRVGVITLARPERLNTFSTRLAEELDDALRGFDDDPDARAIVVEGAGDAFSAGIDLTEYEADADREEHLEWVARMEEPFRTIAHVGTPVVAAAHGHAAANGIGLVAACDLAGTMAEKSPVAVRMGKETYYEMTDMGYDEALSYSNERFAALCATADAAEGIAAFLDGDPLDADEWPGK